MKIPFFHCIYIRFNLKFYNAFQRNLLFAKKRAYCNKSNSGEYMDTTGLNENSNKIKSQAEEYPDEPTTCCMSGCANCVWLEYAEKLSGYYKDGGEKAIKEINEKVTDENVKAFLLHEIRMRNKK